MKLIDMVRFLVDQGFLEQRDPLGEYGEYRWRTGPDDFDTNIAEDG